MRSNVQIYNLTNLSFPNLSWFVGWIIQTCLDTVRSESAILNLILDTRGLKNGNTKRVVK